MSRGRDRNGAGAGTGADNPRAGAVEADGAGAVRDAAAGSPPGAGVGADGPGEDAGPAQSAEGAARADVDRLVPMLSGVPMGCPVASHPALCCLLSAAAGAGDRPRVPPPTMFHRVMDATLINVRRALLDLRARFDGRADPDALGRLELVLAEILNNIALHGAGGGPAPGALTSDAGPIVPDAAEASAIVVHLTVTHQCGALACAVVDDGTPLPAACLMFPDGFPLPEAAAARAGGFGWFIIRDLTRSLFYFREDTRNVLCFSIPQLDARVSRPAAGAA